MTAQKKLSTIYLLEILKKYSDQEHTFTQAQLVTMLQKEYDLKVDRKTVKANLMELVNMHYPIKFSEKDRKTRNSKADPLEENNQYSDFYYDHEFSDAQLRLLIDSVLSSKNISARDKKDLIEKLESLTNQYFHSHVKHISTIPTDMPYNKQVFQTIEVLDDAIDQRKKVSFTYNRYQTDKKLHPTQNSSGEVMRHTVSPYQMAVTNGRYYLICNNDWYDNIAHYRVDRITDIEILDEPIRDSREIEEFKYGFNFPKHMAEHIYMFSGPSKTVHFIAKKMILSDIIDWFGKDINFSHETEETVEVSLEVNEDAMCQWALQYAAFITILRPQSLVDHVGRILSDAAKRYEQKAILNSI